MSVETHAAGAERSEHSIRIVRHFDSPRDVVWKAWNDASEIAKWFGPKGFSARMGAHDFRVGGVSEVVMIGPDGTEYPSKGTYLEIIPQERVVTTDEFGEGYEETEAAQAMDLPSGMVQVTDFFEKDGGTEVVLTVLHPTEEDLRKHEDMGVVEGWNSTLDCLEEYLAERLSEGD